MSYQIQYTMGQARKTRLGKRKTQIWALLLAGILAGGCLIRWRQAVVSFLLPGADGRTGQAIHTMLEQIRSGEPVGEAVTTFCLEVIGHEE